MSNYDEFEEDDIEMDKTIEVTPSTDTWSRITNWIGNHKIACVCSVIGAPILLVWLGAKIFSKTITETVEVEKVPDPTIMDKYDRVPIAEHTYTEYNYVLKDEYRNDV